MTERHVTFRRLDPELPAPTQAHEGDAGFDLLAAVDVTLHPGARAAIPTGLALAIPTGMAGLVLPRSGHALAHGVGLVNAPGLIDSGYRGEVRVLLVNHGEETVSFSRGDRIAQLLVIELPAVLLREAETLPPTSRGAEGFGSSGR